MFSKQAGVLHKLQRRAGGEEDEKEMGRKSQGATSLKYKSVEICISFEEYELGEGAKKKRKKN